MALNKYMVITKLFVSQDYSTTYKTQAGCNTRTLTHKKKTNSTLKQNNIKPNSMSKIINRTDLKSYKKNRYSTNNIS